MTIDSPTLLAELIQTTINSRLEKAKEVISTIPELVKINRELGHVQFEVWADPHPQFIFAFD